MKLHILSLSFLTLIGCAQSAPTNTIGIPAEQVPALPACTSSNASGALTAIPIAGASDLYLVSDDGRPLCVDGSEAIRSLKRTITFVDSTSTSASTSPSIDPTPSGGNAPSQEPDPMPWQPGSTSSTGK